MDVDWRTLDLFWIRVFGVLRELGEQYTQTVRELGPERAGEGPLPQWARTLYGTAAEILSPLRNEEVIVIDWLRHHAAHVFQRGYALRLVKGKVKEGRGIELLGRKIDCSIDETDAARASVLREYHDDKTTMQLAIARKMLPGIHAFAHFHEASLAPYPERRMAAAD